MLDWAKIELCGQVIELYRDLGPIRWDERLVLCAFAANEYDITCTGVFPLAATLDIHEEGALGRASELSSRMPGVVWEGVYILSLGNLH